MTKKVSSQFIALTGSYLCEFLILNDYTLKIIVSHILIVAMQYMTASSV